MNRLWMQLLLCFCYISCYVLCLSDAKLNLVNRYIVYLSGFRFHLHKKKKKCTFMWLCADEDLDVYPVHIPTDAAYV